MDQRTIDALVKAAADFVSAAAHELDDERLAILRSCIESTGEDVRIVTRLKAGALLVEGVFESDRKRVELFRVDVPPLRPLRDGFGHGDGEGRAQ